MLDTTKNRATITASELQSPKKYPLVVKYIGEIRDEYNKKYDVRFGKHIAELGKIRQAALTKRCVVSSCKCRSS